MATARIVKVLERCGDEIITHMNSFRGEKVKIWVRVRDRVRV